jgi:hypothetical protein
MLGGMEGLLEVGMVVGVSAVVVVEGAGVAVVVVSGEDGVITGSRMDVDMFCVTLFLCFFLLLCICFLRLRWDVKAHDS